MPPPLLQYESREVSARRPLWVYPILVLYLLLLGAVVAVPAIIAWGNRGYPAVIAWSAGSAAAVLLPGGSLLLVPIRIRRGRPVSRRTIWLPLVGSSICIAIVLFAAAVALQELLKASDHVMWGLLAGVAASWIIWLSVFGLMMRRTDPQRWNARLYKSVFVGSVLEMLVAVPMHIVVRRRNECCAGMQTGFAICVGAAMAIIALGPAVFVLYHRRWKEVYQAKPPGDLAP